MSKETIERFTDPDVRAGLALIADAYDYHDLGAHIRTLIELRAARRDAPYLLEHALGRFLLLFRDKREQNWGGALLNFAAPLLEERIEGGRALAQRLFLQVFRDPHRFSAAYQVPIRLLQLFAECAPADDDPARYGITAEILAQVDWSGFEAIRTRFVTE